MTKGKLLATKRKNNYGRITKGKKRTTAVRAMDNTAQIDVCFLVGRAEVEVWGATIIYPRAGLDTATPIAPQNSIREVVAEVCRIVKDSMRETKAEYTELYFKMPNAVTTHKHFIYYKDIERDDILAEESKQRDPDLNAYD